MDKEKVSISLIANEKSIPNHNLIWLSFTVYVDDPNGQRILEASPQICARENQPAQISVSNKDGDELSLSVVAKIN